MVTPYRGKFKVSQTYKRSGHKGMDPVGLDNKDIHATVTGVIERAGWDSDPKNPGNRKYGMGQYIRIKDDKTGFMHYFAHMSKLYVKAGQRVSLGDKIGVEGDTGHSFGSHLHYEIRREPKNTTFMDPSPHLGIPNQMGTYVQGESDNKEKEAERFRKIVQDKTGFNESTMQYLSDYKYSAALFEKLAKAMQ